MKAQGPVRQERNENKTKFKFKKLEIENKKLNGVIGPVGLDEIQNG